MRWPFCLLYLLFPGVWLPCYFHSIKVFFFIDVFLFWLPKYIRDLRAPIILYWTVIIRFNQNITSLVALSCLMHVHDKNSHPSTLVSWNSHMLLNSSQLMGCLSSSRGISSIYSLIFYICSWSSNILPITIRKGSLPLTLCVCLVN